MRHLWALCAFIPMAFAADLKTFTMNVPGNIECYPMLDNSIYVLNTDKDQTPLVYLYSHQQLVFADKMKGVSGEVTLYIPTKKNTYEKSCSSGKITFSPNGTFDMRPVK